jgi:hypothetical protein
MQKKSQTKAKKKPVADLPKPKLEQPAHAAYGVFMTHPFMARPHGRALTKDDPIPMNFSCNVTEVGGSLYSNMVNAMCKMFEQYSIVPASSTPDKPVDMKTYITNHKESEGPLRFFAVFNDPPMDFIDFCRQHRLMFRIHEWPTSDPSSNYRIHTFLPDEGNTVFSSYSGIDQRAWMNAEQFHKCVLTGHPPSEGYFAAHDKKLPAFKLSTW